MTKIIAKKSRMKIMSTKKIAFPSHFVYYFETDITCNFFDISSGKTDNEAFTSLPVMEIKANKDVTFLSSRTPQDIVFGLLNS